MDNLKIVFRIAFQNIRKWFTNPRFYIVVLLVIGFLNIALNSVVEFAQVANVKTTPFAFVFLMTDTYVVYMLSLSLILLFCDAPFIDHQQPYLMIRSGKSKWVAGQILYIILASALFILFVIVVSALIFGINISFDSGWGKVWGTLAQTDARDQFQIRLVVDYQIILSYTPLQAMAWTFLKTWLAFVFMAMIMFVLNLKLNRIFGAVVATLFATIPLLRIFLPIWMNYISPLMWVGLKEETAGAITVLPLRYYALIFLGIGILVLIVNSLSIIKKKNIDVLPPV